VCASELRGKKGRDDEKPRFGRLFYRVLGKDVIFIITTYLFFNPEKSFDLIQKLFKNVIIRVKYVGLWLSDF
jgi:hypothetical protein